MRRKLAGHTDHIRHRVLASAVAAVSAVLLVSAAGFAETTVYARAEEIPETFLCGVDVSEVLAEEASGVTYRGEDGSEQDVFKILAGYGVNCVRIRVWNDPYDEEGHGYGGGNCDTAAAAEMGARAAAYGISTMVDFHYSDFWADPGRQLVPKAWEGMSLPQKEAALYGFTKSSLETILDAGADVRIVQVGNETNNGMAGETEIDRVIPLMKAGVHAVRDVSEERGIDIEAAFHLTDIWDFGKISSWLMAFENAGIEYSSVGLSYYPYWHGTLETLTDAISKIREDFGKKVFVAETAYPFTLDDGDGTGNIAQGEDMLTEGYPASPEGQENMLRDVCTTAVSAGAQGVFYWGGIWIPVGSDYESNLSLWETYGSGWASSYASAYDPENVGDYWGGCAWDNQALFDFEGNPLPALNVFRHPGEENGDFAAGMEDGAAETGNEETDTEEINLLLNPGFEEPDYSMWNAVSLTGEYPLDYQDFANDAHTGTIAFHFWSEQDMEFYIEQTVTGLAPGTYRASVCAQGGLAISPDHRHQDRKRSDYGRGVCAVQCPGLGDAG